jgi:hypothetical protein
MDFCGHAGGVVGSIDVARRRVRKLFVSTTLTLPYSPNIVFSDISPNSAIDFQKAAPGHPRGDFWSIFYA